MKKLLSLTLFTLVLACGAMAQTGFTKYTLYVNISPDPANMYVYKNLMYLTAQPAPYVQVLLVWNGTSFVKRNNAASVGTGFFPYLQILGGKGDSLIMLVFNRTTNPAVEGVYAYNLKNDTMYLLHGHTGLSGWPILLRENNKVYYWGKTLTDYVIYQHNITTGATDTFCHLPPDILEVKMALVNGKYYVSQKHITSSSYYCDIYTVDVPNKKLSASAVPNSYNTVGISDLAAIYNDLYFVGYTAAWGTELYRYSGGGPAIRISDINTNSNLDGGNSINPPFNLAVYDNRLYFGASDGVDNLSLYEYYPATNANTRIYKNPNKFIRFNPIDFYVFHNRLYMFARSNQTSIHQPYVYDKVDTPKQLAVLQASTAPNSYTQRYYTEYKNELWFAASDTLHYVQLWRYNDSALGQPPQAVYEIAAPVRAGVYPNPATADAMLSLELKQALKLSMQLTDISGHVLYTKAVQPYNAGKQLLVLPTGSYPAGIYIYTLKDETGSLLHSCRLVKE